MSRWRRLWRTATGDRLELSGTRRFAARTVVMALTGRLDGMMAGYLRRPRTAGDWLRLGWLRLVRDVWREARDCRP